MTRLGGTPTCWLRLSVLVALLTIALKTTAWWVADSVALLSDALESFVNLAGALFAWRMLVVANQPADADHPYGHHKAEYFSAGFEGILIVGAALRIMRTPSRRSERKTSSTSATDAASSTPAGVAATSQTRRSSGSGR
ncbi:MAG: cation diffusion facilitator family transporter, partial [Burkholderiaceae bacterium]